MILFNITDAAPEEVKSTALRPTDSSSWNNLLYYHDSSAVPFRMTPKDLELVDSVDSSTGSVFSASSYFAKSKEESSENYSSTSIVKKDSKENLLVTKKDNNKDNNKDRDTVILPTIFVPTTAPHSTLVRPPLGPSNIKRMALSNPKNSGN